VTADYLSRSRRISDQADRLEVRLEDGLLEIKIGRPGSVLAPRLQLSPIRASIRSVRRHAQRVQAVTSELGGERIDIILLIFRSGAVRD
jgi:hypothetical protein